MSCHRRHTIITDAEQKLWRHVIRDVTPLKPVPKPAPVPTPLPVPSPSKLAPTHLKSSPNHTTELVPTVVALAQRPVSKPKSDARPVWLGHSKVAHLDRKTAERVRSGRLPVHRRLDLHGKNRLDAKIAVERFILSCYAHQERSLIIITGKGALANGGRGVLYQQVPNWLTEPPLRSLVLAVSRAKPKDGGEGALYVLLRRDRRKLR